MSDSSSRTHPNSYPLAAWPFSPTFPARCFFSPLFASQCHLSVLWTTNSTQPSRPSSWTMRPWSALRTRRRVSFSTLAFPSLSHRTSTLVTSHTIRCSHRFCGTGWGTCVFGFRNPSHPTTGRSTRPPLEINAFNRPSPTRLFRAAFPQLLLSSCRAWGRPNLRQCLRMKTA